MNIKIETQGTPIVTDYCVLKKYSDCVVFYIGVSVKNCTYSLYSSSEHDYEGLNILDDTADDSTNVIFTDFPKSEGWQIVCWTPAKRECYFCAIKN